VTAENNPAPARGPAGPPETAVVRAEALGLTYPGGVRALEGIDLGVARGEIVALVGPSGCGKSSLLRLVGGLLQPTEGRLRVGGSPDAPLRTGFVFQDATLLPWRTVADNVRLPLELLGTPRSGHETRIREALKGVGLEEFAGARPAQLSGGMRMRVSLVRALVTDPELLLLDEPFGALDDLTRGRLNEELLVLWQRQRWTGLFVTHNVFEAVFLSQRVLVMSPRPGTIVAEVPVPLELPRRPEVRGSAEFARTAEEVASLLRVAAS
jgi:NitT/TauT family transport system ATP-binding protein